MCVLCDMGLSPQTVVNDHFAADGVSTVTNTGVQNTDAILIGTRWDTTSLTYTFPTSSSYFTDNPYEISPGSYDQGYVTNFVAFTASMQNAARTVLDMFGGVSGLTLTEIAPSISTPADIVFAQTNDSSISTANGRFPGYSANEGHQWYSDSNYSDTPERGTYTWHTIMHETGHTMGLAHGHNPDSISGSFTGMSLTADRNSSEFSIMTYHTHIGDTSPGSTNEAYGYAQTLMMYDIAALQELYGANYAENSGGNTYRWDSDTGEMFIDDIGQGAAGANRIFMTLWDGGGIDTFDLTNYETDVSVDLAPGAWSVFDTAQLSNLGGGNMSRGNVFNALLYNDNSASLVENVNSGIGNDLVVGNRVTNIFMTSAGDDTLVGGYGSDTLYGGADDDLLYGDEIANSGSGVSLFGTGEIFVANTNDTMGTALDVTQAFLLSPDTAVQHSATSAHVTLHYSDVSAGETQWYSVNVNAGSSLIFDVDSTTNLDSFISLYDAGGTRLTFNDDNSVDVGSSGIRDSLLAYVAETSGTYFIEVGEWASETSSVNLLAGAGFDLHITVIDPPIKGGDGDGGIFVNDDTLLGDSGNDTLYGGSGDDYLFGGTGGDTLDGGEGNDTADYSTSNARVTVRLWNGTGEGGDAQGDLLSSIETVTGSSHNDVLIGANSVGDQLNGGGGRDYLSGLSGDDTLDGGAGNDTFAGGDGADTMYGGADNDTVDYSSSNARVTVRLWNGTGEGGDAEGDVLSSIETVTGSSHNDVLIGANFVGDRLNGGDGNDYLKGLSGDDILIGGLGADTLEGNAGNDTVDYSGSGSAVTVRLWNGTGEGGDAQGDVLSSIETVTGSSHNDVLIGANSVGDRLNGGGGRDYLSGLSGDDTLDGGAGNDTFAGGDGADTMYGGADNDTVDYSNSNARVTVRLWNGTGEGGDAEGDVLSSIETVTGSSHNDVLIGANFVGDRLNGGDGYDYLKGLSGDDILIGGLGADTLEGNAGNDTVDYSGSGSAVTVRLWNGTGEGGDAQGDVLSSIETVTGSSHNDVLIGANSVGDRLNGGGGRDYLSGLSGDDTLDGGAGNDTFAGGDGADTMYGGADNDTVDYSNSNARVTVRLWNGTGEGGDAQGDVLGSIETVTGSSHNDVLIGANTVSDRLNGGDGNDYLNGLSGDDTLDGGAGNDTLLGNSGSDVFVFGLGYDGDTISEFEDGLDLIDLISGLSFASLTFSSISGGVRAAVTANVSDYIDLGGVDLADIDVNDFI